MIKNFMRSVQKYSYLIKNSYNNKVKNNKGASVKLRRFK